MKGVYQIVNTENGKIYIGLLKPAYNIGGVVRVL